MQIDGKAVGTVVSLVEVSMTGRKFVASWLHVRIDVGGREELWPGLAVHAAKVVVDRKGGPSQGGLELVFLFLLEGSLMVR